MLIVNQDARCMIFSLHVLRLNANISIIAQLSTRLYSVRSPSNELQLPLSSDQSSHVLLGYSSMSAYPLVCSFGIFCHR